MIESIVSGVRLLLAVTRTLAGICLLGSVAINFANIIGRYFFAVSIPWAEEMMLFLMVGCVFAGIGIVGWSGRHIRMDVFVSALPPRLRRTVEVLSDLVLIATCVGLAVMAWPVITMLASLDQRSDTANMPLVIPQSALPIGFLIMALLVGIRLITRGTARGGDGPDRIPS